ncbi:hypothetical protein [Pseudooctadecabacter jejudonensis]|uniref:Uncharacterized protein n=1 Tax=Pseudooctadecabacter jejudonensis TaxID=1391910 RepID=A0A1Y5T3P2_9RHOB|nr:hypothetical protein [Pseudooctadecabacter jejudonensis]SLN51578.1 hypothetical protein PSJ8397_02700 [Pseudooctadecabacter jejudonensis]
MRGLVFGIGAIAFLGGCGNPLDGTARLSEVTSNAPSASVAATQTSSGQGGLFGRLLNRTPDDPANAAVAAALADVATTADVEPAAAAADTPARGGLFGLFRGNRSSTAEAEVTPARAPSPARFGGLFGGDGASDAPRTGPDATDVEAGTILPFAQIARVCGVGRRDLGTALGSGGGFTVFDTNPNLTTPRPFYITGFADNCARTFTGAVTVAGDIQTHEFIRYQPSNERIAYTTADNAYEAIKASVCRVGRGQPCGARADRLNRNTYFISVYSFFGGTFSAVPTEWAQILLHDGSVLAVSVKDG